MIPTNSPRTLASAAAAAAGVDGGVGLDEVADAEFVAADGADDSHGRRAAQPEGIADRKNHIALLKIVAVGKGGGSQAKIGGRPVGGRESGDGGGVGIGIGGFGELQKGDVNFGIDIGDLCAPPPSADVNMNGACGGNQVITGENIVLVDNDSGAHAVIGGGVAPVNPHDRRQNPRQRPAVGGFGLAPKKMPSHRQRRRRRQRLAKHQPQRPKRLPPSPFVRHVPILIPFPRPILFLGKLRVLRDSKFCKIKVLRRGRICYPCGNSNS